MITDPIELKGLQSSSNLEFTPRRQEVRSGGGDSSFGDMLTRAVNGVDSTIKESEHGVQDFIAGKTDNIHDVMINMQRAQLSFQLMVEVRNKMVDTYHEISRMQI